MIITYQLSFIHSVEAYVTFVLKKFQNLNCNGNEKLYSIDNMLRVISI